MVKKIDLNYKRKVERDTLKQVLGEVLKNGSADRETVIKLLTDKISRISGINLPKKVYPLQEVLQDMVNEMYCYGHFMSKNRAEELLNKIDNL